jgi:hypothetical protein
VKGAQACKHCTRPHAHPLKPPTTHAPSPNPEPPKNARARRRRRYIQTRIGEDYELPPGSLYRAFPRLAAELARTVFIGTTWEAATPADAFAARLAAAALARRLPRRAGPGFTETHAARRAPGPECRPVVSLRAPRGPSLRAERARPRTPARRPRRRKPANPRPRRHFRCGHLAAVPWLASMLCPLWVYEWGFGLVYGLLPGSMARAPPGKGEATPLREE